MQKTLNARQSGFTLIELIVVIVILGILAATALPKFADLGNDARAASLNGAKGALSATSAMAHGKFLISAPTTMTAEGAIITFVNGYPKADAGLASAAGLLTGDYVQDTTTAGTIKFVPVSVNGDAVKKLSCYAQYTEAASTTAPPAITTVTSSC